MTSTQTPRKPRVFAPDDPSILRQEREAEAAFGAEPSVPGVAPVPSTGILRPRGGIGWGGLLVSALAGLVLLAASVSVVRFLTAALARDDWIGWTAAGLLGIAAVSALMLVLRELIGLMRLARLASLRRDAEAALRDKDKALERGVAGRVRALFAGRPELRWQLARFAEHAGDVRDPGDLLRLADREIVGPLDTEARKMVVQSARRVTVVTAMSPMALIDVGFVFYENLRMLRALAGLYGGRPGLVGGLRLARMVVTHIIATGGLALTDDLLGQFLGQDLLRRLSRRLGEGAFNGAMTARVGVAAIEVCRALPFLEQPPVRVRDLLAELFRRKGQGTVPPT